MKNSGKLIAFGASAMMCSAVMFCPAVSSSNVELSSYAIETSVADLSTSDICSAINSYLSQNADWANYTVSESSFEDNTVVLVSKETNEESDFSCNVDAETGNAKIWAKDLDAAQAVFNIWDYTDVLQPVTTTTAETTTAETTTTEATTTETETTTETTTEETTTTETSTSTATSTSTITTTKASTSTSTTTNGSTTTTKAGDSPKTGVAGVEAAIALMGVSIATAFALRKKED